MERCHESVTYAPTPGSASRVATALSETWQKTSYEQGAEVRGLGAAWAYLQTDPAVEKGNR
jgi:hypothetical protein